MIRSCTRPAVSTDTKAAGAVVRPLPIQGVGRRPGYGGDPDSWFDSTRGAYQARAQPLVRRWTLVFVAQWIGRPPPERKAAGSNPAEGTQGTPPVGREGHDGHRTHVAGPRGIHLVAAI